MREPDLNQHVGVFWTVLISSRAREQKDFQERCIALGIQLPKYGRMDIHGRRRLPPNPEEDNYIPVAIRAQTGNWHEDGRPPRVNAELNEDAHFALRCLHKRLPLQMITNPTRTAHDVDRFARVYGAKLAVFAADMNAVETIDNVKRIRVDECLAVLRRWVNLKVDEHKNTFQWEGFKMTQAEISSATEKAYAEWIEGYM